MTRRKLRQLRKRIEALRSRPGSIRSREVEALAKAVGRTPAKRGKEPTYINNPQLPQSPPLTIPHHSRPLKIGTALNILDQLEKDIDDLEELLPR
jgi:hypothetical protein